MTTAPDSEQNETITPSAAAGQRLREAREALGLSRDDVARELRLQEKLIGALEEGDRSQLPPAAFISGYLRSYARLLGLPSEQLIADYLAESVGPSLYRATDRTGVQLSSSRDIKFRLITFAVIAVTAVLFGAWWANERFSFVSLEQGQGDDAGGAQHVMEEKLPEPAPLYQPHPEELETAPAQPDGIKTAPAQPESAKAPAVPAVAAPKTAAAPAPVVPAATPQKPAAPSAAPAQKVPAATPSVTPAPAAPEVPPAKPAPSVPVVTTEQLSPSVPQSTLLLEYQAASWTEVEDANGRLLVYETINPGRKLQLHGVAPFKVFLGYAPGVVVYLNGSQFSHAAFQRGDLARFSVGSSQDNRPLAR